MMIYGTGLDQRLQLRYPVCWIQLKDLGSGGGKAWTWEGKHIFLIQRVMGEIQDKGVHQHAYIATSGEL